MNILIILKYKILQYNIMANLWAKTAGEFWKKSKGKFEKFGHMLKSPELKAFYNEKITGKTMKKRSSKGGAAPEKVIGGSNCSKLSSPLVGGSKKSGSKKTAKKRAYMW